jgi:hypothetical protein
MISSERYYFGNAKADQVRGSGGLFVPPELGLRRQTDVETEAGSDAASASCGRPASRLTALS